MLENPTACKPGSIERDGQADDDVADLQVAAARAEVDHLAAELVAHHGVELRLEDRQLHRVRRAVGVQLVHHPTALLAVLQQVQIAAADAAGQHLRQHLAGARSRVGEVVDPQLPISHDRCAHCRDRSSFAALRSRSSGSGAEVGDRLGDHGPRRVGVDA